MIARIRAGLVVLGMVAVLLVGAAGLGACGDEAKTGGGANAVDTPTETPETPTCATCTALKASEAGGWCDECGVGHYKGQTTLCKSCLTAMQTDGECECCGVRYEDGVKVTE